jgi:hypothetical protein
LRIGLFSRGCAISRPEHLHQKAYTGSLDLLNHLSDGGAAIVLTCDPLNQEFMLTNTIA